ncbi:protein of unknown function [Bacillus sp. OV322]|uniref:YwqH-like family protein n=1 Tax=Bacillus sp. OV322 TaxID=1882764 RepID=UPI0008E5D378|nr:DUF5082 family protein [Bacillus sp. OV322]SFC27380.1 protein of unknown function [Bacillus sp. OV322]
MFSALYARLLEKEGQLTKLQTCSSQLYSCQHDFKFNQKIISEPILTPLNWNGTLAAEFTDIRENNMVQEYSKLANEQLTDVISAVEAKIIEVKAEIESIKLQIASFEEQERLNASKGK